MIMRSARAWLRLPARMHSPRHGTRSWASCGGDTSGLSPSLHPVFEVLGNPGAITREGGVERFGVEAELLEAVAVDAMLVLGILNQPPIDAGLELGAEVITEIAAHVARHAHRVGHQGLVGHVEE